MRPIKDRRFDFYQRREPPVWIAEEVRIDYSGVFTRYYQQIVSPDRPMEHAVLDQTRLEINEWPLCLDFKGCCVSVAAHCHRINIMFPIQVSAKNQRPCSPWVTNANFSFEAVSGSLRHSVVVCVPFTGTRLLYGFAGDQTVHDQCNEAYRRHGVEHWEDPSEPWIARRPSFQLTERHKVIHRRLHTHRFNFGQAFLQLAFQPQAREHPYQ